MSTPTPAIAASGSAPSNLVKPTISGDPREGTGLSATNGTWAGTQPITYAFQWNRCDQSGNGCAPIPGAASATYAVATADVGHTVTVTVTAHNPRGNASATSGPTALIAPARAGGAAIAVSTVGLPDRLVVDAVRFSPQPIRTRDAVTARFHVSDLRGFSIQGALVYAIGLPYGWVRNAPEVATDTGGWATITLLPTARMPLGTGALVVFARARKPGDNLLAGVSTRRLVQASIR